MLKGRSLCELRVVEIIPISFYQKYKKKENL